MLLTIFIIKNEKYGFIKLRFQFKLYPTAFNLVFVTTVRCLYYTAL